MAAYIRPPVEAPVFRDADGRVIPYGRRWRNGDPPEDSYSRVSHPERFAPLHQIAEALVRHLTAVYDSRSEDVPAPEGALRSIRVTPSGPDQAPLTFVFTDFPSVSIRAGLLHEQGFPSCGCDACDEDWREPANELERLVLTVAAGGFAEWCRPGFGSRYGSSLEFFDGGGSHSGETSARTVSAERFKAAKRRLRALPDGWAAWSPKA